MKLSPKSSSVNSSKDSGVDNFKYIASDGQYKTVVAAYVVIFATSFFCIAYNYAFLEMAFVDAVYFGVIVLLTVGYGDLIYPDLLGYRIMGCLFIGLGNILLTVALCTITTDQQMKIQRRNPMIIEKYIEGSNLYSVKRNIELAKRNVVVSFIRHLFFHYMGWITVGALTMSYMEGWSIDTSFYWGFQTISTIGLGDITPETEPGKWLCCAFTIVGWVIGVEFVSVVVATIREVFITWEQISIAFSTFPDAKLYSLQEFFNSPLLETVRGPNYTIPEGGVSMSRSEFILLLSIKSGLISSDDISICGRIFDEVDISKDGTLDRDDVLRTLV